MINKKVVWLPYDMDTALGIDNVGALVFSYNLEDTDQTAGGKDIFEAQSSVMWLNLRDAFPDEIRSMYQNLRTSGALSYNKVEKMFEDHQAKWPEAIFNEDSWYKYLQPLIENGNGSYLSMLQGSKAEQRKWWLYNRFRYMDSKWNAGDALADFITIRCNAVEDITVTPYADIYPTIKYGSKIVQARGRKDEPCTLINSMDSMNNTETYIYSASQLASIGDISPLKIGYADFSMGTKLQNIKIGDSDPNYSNENLLELYLGNNILLQTLDVRNSPKLQQPVDISGCVSIQEVYFDGTSITSLALPNGGVLNTLHLPGTITNLTIRNQPELTDLTVDSYENITTLWIESAGIVDENSKQIVRDISPTARVRLLGINWEIESSNEFKAIFDKVNTYSGLDENGNNTPIAQLTGTVHTSSASISLLTKSRQRYPYVTFSADSTYSLVSKYLSGNINDSDFGEVAPYLTSISQSAFSNNTSLTNISLLNVLNIGQNGFNGCTNLKTVTLKYIHGIGNYAFAGCSKLEEFVAEDDGVRFNINQEAFSGCTKLQTVSLPGAQLLQANCFVNCTSLVNVDLPNLTTINRYSAFRNCSSLRVIKFPKLITTGGYGDNFNSCTSLEIIYYSALTTFSAANSTQNWYTDCPNLKCIVLPSATVVTLRVAQELLYLYDGTLPNAYIYVPNNLISSYQNATNWATVYASRPNIFRPLENYTIDGSTTGDIDETKI